MEIFFRRRVEKLHIKLKSDRFGMEILRSRDADAKILKLVKIRPFRYGNLTFYSELYKLQLVKIRPFRYGNLENTDILILYRIVKIRPFRYGKTGMIKGKS